MKRFALLSTFIITIALFIAACQPNTIAIGNPTSTSTQEVAEPTKVATNAPSAVPTVIVEPTQAPTNASTATTGSVSGRLGYPSETIPQMRVVAFLLGTDTFFSLDTELNQTSYQLDGLTEGKYHVVAYTKGGGSFPEGLGGGFTQAALCGMGEACTDHSLVEVSVTEGQVVENVDIIDWLIPLPPMPVEGQPVMGTITGQLSYPSEFIPPIRVVAFRVEDDQTYFIDTQMNEGTYVLPLPAGTYRVVAYVGGPDADATSMAGGYSQAVLCGLTAECTDHSLINITVGQGSVTYGINPGDFYAPEGTFPAFP